MKGKHSSNEQTGSGRSGRIRREQGTDQHRAHSNRAEASRPAGSSTGVESERIGGAVRTGADQFKSRGQIAGGILRQLIVRADNQLAKVEDQLRQLEITRQTLEQEREEARREQAQLQTLLENLQKTTQENS